MLVAPNELCWKVSRRSRRRLVAASACVAAATGVYWATYDGTIGRVAP